MRPSSAARVPGSALLAFGLALGACSSSPAKPTPTGATCPADSTLTYEGFARPFMEAYCVRCHDSSLRGADRNGAPLYHDFDTELGIVLVGDHVDEYSAAGPDAVNEFMPPDGATPTLEERQALGEWLACALERINDRPDAGPDADASIDAAP